MAGANGSCPRRCSTHPPFSPITSGPSRPAYLATVESISAVATTRATRSSNRPAGRAQVISSGGIPVRARLSAHPTLAAAVSWSLASATMWH